MTHVHYKFSSKLNYDTAVFDGPHITLRELKRQIMGREKLRAADCDLQITNAQSKQEYTDDEGLIPKGSSVIVRRIPVSGGKSSSKNNNTESTPVQFHHMFGATKAMDDQSSSRGLPFFSEMANLAKADVSEEDKLKVILHQSPYDPMNYNKKFGAVLPANYTCYRCGNTGHHIRNCPTTGQDKNFEAPLRIKKSTGIPRSFMVEVDDPNIKGAMLTTCGRYAIPTIDAEAYAIGKKEKPPFISRENPKSEAQEDPVPDELLCLICHDLLSDAVVIPCCGNSYCDDCIRTTLLDSEEHVCPTCSQSDVSPDTLIANKFLRQAVNNFKKERGYTKIPQRCGGSQFENPTTRLSTVPTPPPLTGQSQPQKPHQPTYSQQVNQDSVQHHPKVAETPPLPVAPPAAPGPTSAYSALSTSLQPEQSCLEMPVKEAEEKTQDDSAVAAAAPSVLISYEEPSAAPSQQIPVVNHTVVAEQPPSVSMIPQTASSSLGSTGRPFGPPTRWDSSCTSSGRPSRGWNESQQFTSSSSSSSYSATTPPLFAPPIFLSAHQSHRGYPPVYQQTTPIWTVTSPQGTPIPSLCSTTPTSSIPSLIPNEWYRHQRRKKESSPPRESTCRRSSSSSNSKSSKSKSSCSYSRSSSRSRSRSRSRSQGRSRHRSPYSRHRNLYTHSHPSCSYSYGYKRSRSPTPSSSSSSRVGHYSRSPSGHQKKRHHSRYQNKKSSSSSYKSKRRGEHSARETGGLDVDLASYLPAQHPNQTTGLELERERYMQWKQQYKDWCEKYFSSYVGHFHQLPLPLINFPPPPPPPQWVDTEGSNIHSHASSDSRYQAQGRHTTSVDGRSPSSQSSSDSRSPPSYSSSDIHSTPSQSFSDSRSSPSHISNDSRSPPSQSSSYGRSTPSEDGTPSSAYQQRFSQLANTLTKGINEVQERSKDDKEVIMKKTESLSTLKHDQSRIKKREEGRREESPDVADSTDDRRNHQRLRDTGPGASKHGTSEQDEAPTSNTVKSVQPSLKANKSLEKGCERESRQQRNMKGEKGWRRGKHSGSRQHVERPHNVKPSKEVDTVDSNRYRNPGGIKVADTRSENNRKRKYEEGEKIKTQECKSESPIQFERKKQKNEKEIKTRSLTEKDIWEEGIKLKLQKKISININLDGKRKQVENEKQELSCSEITTGKIKGAIKKGGNGEEETLNRRDTEVGVNQNKEINREKEENVKAGEPEARGTWEKGIFRDEKAGMWEKTAGVEENMGEKIEIREEEDLDLWHCALKGVEDGECLWEEVDRMEVRKGEEVTRDERSSMTGNEGPEERIRKESRGQGIAELVRNSQKKWADVSTCNKNREIPLEELKPREEEELREGGKRMVKKEEGVMRSEEKTSRKDDGSSCKDHQERTTMVKSLEKYTKNRAAERENGHVLIQIPLTKWEEESKQEQDEEEITGHDGLYEGLPPPLVVQTNQKTEGENKPKSQSSVNVERDRDRAMQEDSTLSSSSRAVTPSSGKYRTDSTDGELERRRDRERGRESERPRDRQKESNRAKERRSEEERWRYQGSERGHSSTISIQSWNRPLSGYFSSSSERRDWRRGCDKGSEKNYIHPSGKPSGSGRRERSSLNTATEVPDKNEQKIHKDTSLDSKCKDKKHPQDYYNHRDPSQSYKHQDRSAGTHHSASFLSRSQGNDRDPFPYESFGLSRELMQNRSQNESREEKWELKRNKVDKLIKESKGDGSSKEREGGSQWEYQAHKFARETRWQEKRELEEGERPSSCSSNSSSSASLENDDRRKGRKKHKKHRKEKRQAGVLEFLEDRELKKYKKSKKNTERREAESGGEEDDKGKEEEDQGRLSSLMLS